MKYLISIIKFFNKKQLETLQAECVAQYEAYMRYSYQAPKDRFLVGQAEAYRNMAKRLRKLMEE